MTYISFNQHEPVYLITPFPKAIRGVDQLAELHSYQSSQMVSFNGHMDMLESELKAFVKKGYEIHMVVSSEERLGNLREFCDRAGFLEKIIFEKGNLSQGMDFQELKLCYISDNDIFGEQRSGHRRKKHKAKGQQIQSFADLAKGDYVVHENHGIGKFVGIEQLNILGEKKDYIKIKYAGNDYLYVPVEQMDIVQKYIGSEGLTPKVNKLSGNDWKVTKAKARAAIAEMTSELIELYAKRQMENGHAFSEDTVWQREFEDGFPYTETDDQLKAIEEIKADMEKTESMDRLLCGDVGFGKTEVAARALFKCIADGKQAAVLVPTTLLANQHYYTLKDRFEHFPLKVEMLSRFRTDAQQKEILDELAKGGIDLIIGTHRLLSKDVKFKDLGLLVVDEEQRFGVGHKEAIKQMKKNVDVLTLSATPIPRTLNMSLTGIKDMSLIEEPPEERYPVQTYVLEQDDGIMREAILRELDRGGQVFVIYNRVRGISQVADKITRLVPEAKIAVGHGRMNEQALEDVMLSFVNGESNVLVATTIVENGIDIQNANTLIVLDADRFGLAQLYQLRGRVGRSNRMAYAYLMYQKDKVLTEVAEKRLKAIREFTEFGAGFKVAMRDLEIRGAGNLLGSEQSGHMMNIGYELYCKLVDDAVRAMNPTAISEITEQLIRCIVGLTLAYSLYKTSLVKAAAGASFGASAGSIAGLAVIFVIYLLNHKTIMAKVARNDQNVDDGKSIAKEIVAIAIPIIIGCEIMPIMTIIDSTIIMRVLQNTGWSYTEANYLYGLFSGFCNALIAFPQIFTQAVAVSLVPAVSARWKLNDMEGVHSTINLGYRTTMQVERETDR